MPVRLSATADSQFQVSKWTIKTNRESTKMESTKENLYGRQKARSPLAALGQRGSTIPSFSSLFIFCLPWRGIVRRGWTTPAVFSSFYFLFVFLQL
jgi:hypothetical protein